MDKTCPHCEKLLLFAHIKSFAECYVFDQLGHDWHKECWEAFQVEYEQILESNLVKEN